MRDRPDEKRPGRWFTPAEMDAAHAASFARGWAEAIDAAARAAKSSAFVDGPGGTIEGQIAEAIRSLSPERPPAEPSGATRVAWPDDPRTPAFLRDMFGGKCDVCGRDRTNGDCTNGLCPRYDDGATPSPARPSGDSKTVGLAEMRAEGGPKLRAFIDGARPSEDEPCQACGDSGEQSDGVACRECAARPSEAVCERCWGRGHIYWRVDDRHLAEHKPCPDCGGTGKAQGEVCAECGHLMSSHAAGGCIGGSNLSPLCGCGRTGPR